MLTKFKAEEKLIGRKVRLTKEPAVDEINLKYYPPIGSTGTIEEVDYTEGPALYIQVKWDVPVEKDEDFDWCVFPQDVDFVRSKSYYFWAFIVRNLLRFILSSCFVVGWIYLLSDVPYGSFESLVWQKAIASIIIVLSGFIFKSVFYYREDK